LDAFLDGAFLAGIAPRHPMRGFRVLVRRGRARPPGPRRPANAFAPAAACRRVARLRAAHLAFAGVGVQLLFAGYAWFESPPTQALDVAVHGLVVGLLAGLGLLGLVPAFLLLRPRTHGAGRWTALALGAWYCLLVFWALEGVLLLAAFLWATKREKGGEAGRPEGRPPEWPRAPRGSP
jgi:hypothetical protein